MVSDFFGPKIAALDLQSTGGPIARDGSYFYLFRLLIRSYSQLLRSMQYEIKRHWSEFYNHFHTIVPSPFAAVGASGYFAVMQTEELAWR